MFVQMFIGELLDRERLEDLRAAIACDLFPQLMGERGVHGVQLIAEEGESVLLILTISWCSRDRAVAWASSADYRKLRCLAYPAMRGEFIMKLFRVQAVAA